MKYIPNLSARLLSSLLLALTAFLSLTDSVRAGDPLPEALKNEIPPLVDPEYGKILVLDVNLSSKDENNIQLISYNFRQDVPRSVIANQWIWASRVLSFENRCLGLNPLGNPRIIRLGGTEGVGEQWGQREGDVEFRVELIVDPDMHELEIIDSKYETLGKYDLSEPLDNYCDLNADDSLCAKRKAKLIALSEPDGLEEYSKSVLEDFGSIDHMQNAGEFDSFSVSSTTGGEIPVIDLMQTSQSSTLFETSYDPFDESTNHVLYNGRSVLSDNGASYGEDPDGAIVIEIPGGTRGLSMTLGSMTFDSVTDQSKQISDAAKQFNDLGEDGVLEELRQIFNSITIENEKHTTAIISVFNLEGETLEKIEVDLFPIPGFHTFSGVITPYDLIGKVEIEYVGGVVEETLTNLLIIPPDADKLPSMDFLRKYKPCPGEVVFFPSNVKDFPILSDLEVRLPALPISTPTPSPIPPTPTATPMPEPTPTHSAEPAPVPISVNCNSASGDGYVAGNLGILVIPIALWAWRRRNKL